MNYLMIPGPRSPTAASFEIFHSLNGYRSDRELSDWLSIRQRANQLRNISNEATVDRIIHHSFVIRKLKNGKSVICFKTKNKKTFSVSESNNEKPIKPGLFLVFADPFYRYSFLD